MDLDSIHFQVLNCMVLLKCSMPSPVMPFIVKIGGTTGFGDLEPGMHFLTSLPNLFGGGMGNMKKK